MSIINTMLIVVLFLSSSAMMSPDRDGKEIYINGQIIAGRWCDFFQYASLIENKEYYLFRTAGDTPTVIKIIHQHYGYSLMRDLLTRVPILRIKVRRDVGCDETINSFINEADRLTKRMTKGETNGIEPIQYLIKTKEIELPNDFLLKCFVMQQTDFEVVNNH